MRRSAQSLGTDSPRNKAADKSLLRNGADEKADLRNFPSKHFNLLSEWLLVEKTKSTEREGGKEGFAIILTVPIY